MSQSAQSIISSHKTAAKRATEYLQEARNLKLRPPEALELVARVLGVANWKTLLGMAEQGRAPGQPSDLEPSFVGTVSEATERTVVSDEVALLLLLEEYYKALPEADGQHPDFPEEDFEEKADEGLDYWQWVLEQMRERNEMLPWERDALSNYKIAEAAGLTLNTTPEGEWYLEGDDISGKPKLFRFEVEAWAYAARWVEKQARSGAGDAWGKLTLDEQLPIIERYFYRRDEHGAPVGMSRVAYDITDENFKICQEAGMFPASVRNAANGEHTYTTLSGLITHSQKLAVANQARSIGWLVSKAMGWEGTQWSWLPERVRANLARNHALQGLQMSAKD